MSIYVNLKGSLEPIQITGDFGITMNMLELAKMRELNFMVTKRAEDGTPMAIQISEIVTITEGGPDADRYDDD